MCIFFFLQLSGRVSLTPVLSKMENAVVCGRNNVSPSRWCCDSSTGQISAFLGAILHQISNGKDGELLSNHTWLWGSWYLLQYRCRCLHSAPPQLSVQRLKALGSSPKSLLAPCWLGQGHSSCWLPLAILISPLSSSPSRSQEKKKLPRIYCSSHRFILPGWGMSKLKDKTTTTKKDTNLIARRGLTRF